MSGDFDGVKALLDAGADPNELEGRRRRVTNKRRNCGPWGSPPHYGFDRTPLMLACINGRVKVARLLVSRGAHLDIMSNEGSALFFACYWGCAEMVRLLLEKGADKMKATHDGGTPLQVACFMGQLEVVQLLLDAGVAKDRWGKDRADSAGATPLIEACAAGHLEVVRLLLKHDANPHVENNQGFTPLFCACQAGNVEMVAVLLDADVDVDKMNESGHTALMSSCAEGHLELIKFLLQRGATACQESKEVFTKESNALLRKWHGCGPTRQEAVRRLGWDYVDAPYVWTPQNHALLPAPFRATFVALTVALHDQFATVNQIPGDFVQRMASLTHTQMTLTPWDEDRYETKMIPSTGGDYLRLTFVAELSPEEGLARPDKRGLRFSVLQKDPQHKKWALDRETGVMYLVDLAREGWNGPPPCPKKDVPIDWDHDAPYRAPGFVCRTIRAAASGFIDDYIASPADQAEAYRWLRQNVPSEPHQEAAYLTDCNCYMFTSVPGAVQKPNQVTLQNN